MTGEEKLRQQADKLKQEGAVEAQKEASEEVGAKTSLEVRRTQLSKIYSGEENIGTEDVGVDELNIPSLKLVQPNKPVRLGAGGIAHDGWFFRTDTKEEMQTVHVTLLVFRKAYAPNYNKTADERKHIYFGLYDSTNDPFRMYLRGWSLSGSREFLTEVKHYASKFRIPMFSLLVTLSSVTRPSVKPDEIVYAIKMDVVKDDEGFPLIEENPNRIEVLREFVDRFMHVTVDGSDEDSDTQNDKMNKTPAKVVAAGDTGPVDDQGIPF